MADKKLNAVSTASDGAYIYAEDASGNQIKISKADLASVVAGLLPIKLRRFTISELSRDVEVPSGITAASGILFAYHAGSGTSIFYPFGSFPFLDDKAVNSALYSTTLAMEDIDNKICIYRKTTNGEIFIKNRAYDTNQSLSIFLLSFY